MTRVGRSYPLTGPVLPADARHYLLTGPVLSAGSDRRYPVICPALPGGRTRASCRSARCYPPT